MRPKPSATSAPAKQSSDEEEAFRLVGSCLRLAPVLLDFRGGSRVNPRTDAADSDVLHYLFRMLSRLFSLLRIQCNS